MFKITVSDVIDVSEIGVSSHCGYGSFGCKYKIADILLFTK